MNLDDSKATIIPYGLEVSLDKTILDIIKKKYDAGSMFLRTRPDFFIIEEDEIYFVEAKQETNNLEAIQLLYNKQHDRKGFKVLYSFPNFMINASLIPIDTIIIPENYKEKFDKNLKHLFELEGVQNFRYVGHVAVGSGDAFVPVEPEELQILAQGTTP